MSRDLRLLVAGSAVSFAGDAIALLALTLRLQPHGSGWVGALLAAELLPATLLAPVSGRLVDRVETRRLLVALMSLQALVAVPLAVVRTPWLVVVLFVVLGSLAALVAPASNALVPAVTDDPARGYRLVATGVTLGWIVGPAAGGLLVSVLGSTGAILIDAGSFVLLALTRLALSARRVPVPREEGERRGPHPLWRSRSLTLAVLTTSVALMCGNVDNVAAPFRFVDELHGSPSTYGAYLAIWSLGALAGAPLTGRLASPSRALAVGNVVAGLGIAGVGLAPSTEIAYVAAAAGGVGNGLLNAAQGAVVAAHVPESEHGRAFASWGAVLSAGLLAGTLIGPLLVDAFRAGGAMVVAGALTCAVALPLVLRRTNRVPA